MKKALAALLLLAALTVSLAACSLTGDRTTTTATEAPIATEAPADTEAPTVAPAENTVEPAEDGATQSPAA